MQRFRILIRYDELGHQGDYESDEFKFNNPLDAQQAFEDACDAARQYETVDDEE